MSNNLHTVFSKFGIGKKRRTDNDDHKEYTQNNQNNSKNLTQYQFNQLSPLEQQKYIEHHKRLRQQQLLKQQQRSKRNRTFEQEKRRKTMAQPYGHETANETANGTKKNPNLRNGNNHHSSNHSHHSHHSQKKEKHKSSSKHHPNGKYKHLDSKLFHPNMTPPQIVKLLGLRSAPRYQTDEKGYIDFCPGLNIRNSFVVLDTLGRGTFSKVFEAVDTCDQTRVAIKVIRNTHRYIEAAKTELRVLQHLTTADDGTSACIHLKDHFSWNNHPVFVFKLYGPSIYTIMSRNRFRPFPDSITRSLTYQICNAIQFLHHLGMIFTDLKPENMVFVDGRTYLVNCNSKTQSLPIDTRIKIVDFGSAVYEPRYDSNNPKTWKFKDGYNYLIQTRHYRAPEVVLEMAWKRPVDVWSVGCVVLEFLYGSMVFNTHCPIDHLNQMQKMIGPIPRDLIRASSDDKYKQLFHHPDGTLKLEDARKSRAQAQRLDSYFNSHSKEHRHLYDLVGKCLQWRAAQRIQGCHLLKHEYFHFIKNKLSHQHKFEPPASHHGVKATVHHGKLNGKSSK